VNNIIKLDQERLKRKPVIYTIIFTHTHDEFSFKVYDILDTPESKLAVAKDLDLASKSLFNSVKNLQSV
jgi:hypothetical protein